MRNINEVNRLGAGDAISYTGAGDTQVNNFIFY